MTVQRVMQEINILKNGYKVYVEADNKCVEEGNYEEASNLILESNLIIFKINKLENLKVNK